MFKILGKLFILFLIPLCSLFAEPKYVNQSDISVFYRETKINFDSAPVKINEIVYVSIRDIARSMALELSYNNRQDYYEIKRPGDFRQIIFKLHSKKIKINGRDEQLTYPVHLIKNQYYVPLNDFLWTLGYFVRIDGKRYMIMTKIKDINWTNQTLSVVGEAPLECSIAPLLSGYEITIFNTILGRHADELQVEDGGVRTISYYQESLQPAKIKIKLTTVGRPTYTAFQEDSENAYRVKFNYQQLAKSPPVITSVEAPLEQKIATGEPEKLTSAGLSSGGRLFASNTALWLPERVIGAKASVDLVISGTLYPDIPLRSVNEIIYVPFDRVFKYLGCSFDGQTLIDNSGQKYELLSGQITGAGVNEKYKVLEGGYVPLVQTIRLTGYGAYFSENKVYINPRIKELLYQRNGSGTRLLVKANNKIYPKNVFYLKKPYRCLIDIPNAVFDAPQNIIRSEDKFCTQVRGAQFDRGVVRIVLELPDEKVKPAIVYGEEGRVLELVVDPKAVLEPVTVVAQKKQDEESVIRLDSAESVKPETVYVVDTVPQTAGVLPVASGETTAAAEVKPVEKLTLPKKPQTNVMKGLRVAILPGHGGEDVGAISRTGYMEKTPTLEVSKKLAKLLSDAGAIPLLCREDDRNVSLDEQAEFAIRNNADVLISVHFNAFTDESVGGAETYYYKDIDYALAKAIHEEIVKTTGAKNKGLKKAQMHNLNHTTMPGVLIEPLFISNRREEIMIKSDIYQWKLAKALYNGIEEYLREEK